MKQISLHIAMILVFFINGYAQKKAFFVADAVNKKAIPYVSVFNGKDGTYSDMQGKFKIEYFDTLYISCVGYNSVRITRFASLDTIYLSPSIRQLDEVVILSSKEKTYIHEVGMYKHREKARTTNILKAVLFLKKPPCCNCTIEEVMFRLTTVRFGSESKKRLKNKKLVMRVLLLNGDNYLGPHSLVTEDNIIIKSNNRSNKMRISLNKYHIKAPKKGFFIGVEFLGIEENGAFIPYDVLSKEDRYQFAPSKTHKEKGSYSWTYSLKRGWLKDNDRLYENPFNYTFGVSLKCTSTYQD